jgi:competence protein CoiA
MKFALVHGQRQEAQPGLSGECPACGSPMVARCGEFNVWHWAHRSRSHCDPWWENEGPWHRNWKSQFPTTWQEILLTAEDGERHIADVKTDRDWVLEFQNSFLNPQERRSRNAFYSPKLIWVVNGLRRPTDITQFEKVMGGASHVGARNAPFWVASPGNSRLLREWSGSDAQVLFDFGPERGLWWVLGRLSNDQVIIARYSQTQFIEAHGGIQAQKATDFDALVKDLRLLVEECEGIIRPRSAVRFQPPLPAPRRPTRRRRRL